MGISGFTPDPAVRRVTGLSDDEVEQIRKQLGIAFQPLPTTVTRWFQADLETAAINADRGVLTTVGRLWRSMQRDGLISGLAETRTAGLVALPRRFRGEEGAVEQLTSQSTTRALFDEMFPPSELALLAADGIAVGVGVGEMVDVAGRDHRVLVRLDPEFLEYRWHEGRWYYRSSAGPVPIQPGDGRWILHIPGGRVAPWVTGKWHSLGRAFIAKEHAMLHRGNFGGKLANPARVAHAPNAATEGQRKGFLSQLIQWGVNTVFELPPGWDVKLVESNGRGWEVFGTDIDTANNEIMIALAGQIVTVTGGAGFANAGIHASIRADLIKKTADDLAHTINTQGIPPWLIVTRGPDGLVDPPRVEWDVAPPKDREQEAKSLSEVARAIESLRNTLASSGLALNVQELIDRFGLPVSGPLEQQAPSVELAPTDIAKVIRVREARAAQGLDPLGDERDDMTISELEAANEEEGEATIDGNGSVDSSDNGE